MVLFLILGFSFFLSLIVERSDVSVPTETALNHFPVLNVNAKAVYVYDVSNHAVLFAKNENLGLSLASLTKLMTALVAEGTSPIYGTVTISEEALRAEGDSGLYRGEKWSLKNLLDFSLITSSNDGMKAIALTLGALAQSNATSEVVIDDFVREMNIKAQKLGLQNTYFWNETGLDLVATSTLAGRVGDPDIQGGAYGTAKDMTALLEYILVEHPTLLTATKEKETVISSLDSHIHVAKNTNILVTDIPRLVGSKTGFTDTAGGNLVFVFDPDLGRPIIVSILGSTAEGRFQDARMIVEAVMQYLSQS
jgi:D-alanyl-D-alanine carboxypeptidase (penicillin-binding protein 5/6)